MQRHKHTLANGLTLVGEQTMGARSLAMGFFARTGARDEQEVEAGVSHFLEHMMFKGTPRRSPFDVNRDFDAMGARYNAFTSEENTVYYGQVLPRFQSRLFDLLSDMMRPALRDDDFSTEKNVILEEIAMYQDRPQFLTFDRLRTAFYGAHPLGHSVLGSTDSIRALEVEQMRDYFRRRYASDNLTLVLTGNYDWSRAVEEAEARCGSWQPSGATRTVAPLHPASGLHFERPRDEAGSDKFNRSHVALMSEGFSAQDARRHAASVAAECVGGGESSRLYWALVHPGVAEAASLGHSSSDGAGTFSGYLLSDPAQASSAFKLYRETVEKACEEGLQDAEVERVKKRVASASALRTESPMGRLTAVGYDWIYRGEERTPDEALEAILNVTTDECNAILRARPMASPTVVALGPVETL